MHIVKKKCWSLADSHFPSGAKSYIETGGTYGLFIQTALIYDLFVHYIYSLHSLKCVPHHRVDEIEPEAHRQTHISVFRGESVGDEKGKRTQRKADLKWFITHWHQNHTETVHYIPGW